MKGAPFIPKRWRGSWGLADKTPPASPVDLSTLPSIESLSCESDLVPFLQAGVPPDVLKAAFRHVWRADPAIRDFIGISESQWDFNDPLGMPGFGVLEAIEGSQHPVSFSTASVVESSPQDAEVLEVANPQRDGQPDPVWTVTRAPAVDTQPRDLQQQPTAHSNPLPGTQRRRHGSALPREG